MIQPTCGEAFRSYVYETSDGRWFDRSGMPTEAPKKLEKDDFETTNEESSKVA
jgi:hypothetical protein